MHASETTLSQISLGATAEVVAIEGEDPLARRLDDLGFWVGTQVTLVRVAPMGDPLQVRLRGFRLAMRRAEADRVRVRLVGGEG